MEHYSCQPKLDFYSEAETQNRVRSFVFDITKLTNMTISIYLIIYKGFIDMNDILMNVLYKGFIYKYIIGKE